VFRRDLLIAVGILAAVAVTAEGGLRLAFGLGNPPLMQKDDAIGYMFAANQDLARFGHKVSINQYHQRSPRIEPVPAPGVVRILVVGDSVTFGGVLVDQTDTFPTMLDRRLSSDGIRSEVLNASAGSWGIENEEAYIRQFGTFGSQLVVLQIGSHDLLQVKSDQSVVGTNPNYPDRRPLTAIGELLERYILARVGGDIGDNRDLNKPEPAKMDRQFARNMNAFSGEVAASRDAGAIVLVLHTPDRDEVVAEYGAFQGSYREFHDSFNQLSAQLKVPVIDLSVEWRGMNGVDAYFRDGVHFTVAGNRAVSTRLAAAIEMLLDCPSNSSGR
jgi:lysophospholipase L1-like esterase